MHPQDAAAFQANFVALDRLVAKFQHYLIHMTQFQGLMPHGTRDLLVTHSLAYAATIQLHRNFAFRNANSNRKCLAAASAVVMILDNADLSGVVYINPIIGVREVITIGYLRCSYQSADALDGYLPGHYSRNNETSMPSQSPGTRVSRSR